MRVDLKVRAIYEEEIKNITKTSDNWKALLRLSGNLYRYEFDNLVMIYAQKPKATLCADYDTWRLVDRFVKRGSKGIAIFPSRALNPRMRYVFDISDTGGKNVNLTWSLDKENAKDYLDMLVSSGQLGEYEHSDEFARMTSLKDFTMGEIRGIMKEEFQERISNLSSMMNDLEVMKDKSLQLSGSGIRNNLTKRKGLLDDMNATEYFLFQSIMYVVGTRCGFDLSVQEQDFSQIVNVTDEETIYHLGSLVCDVSCSVLRSFSRNLKTIENERRNAHGRESNHVSPSGWTTLSEYSNGGTKSSEYRKVRTNGNEVFRGERKEQIQNIIPIRDARREDEGSGRGSQSIVRDTDESVFSKEQANRSILNHGDVETQGASEDASRRSSAPPNSDEISLEDNLNDEELNRELDELNSFGNDREVKFEQTSLFDAQIPLNNTSRGVTKTIANGYQFTYLEPKRELVVPAEYIKDVILKGSGFVNGKSRICKIFETEIDAGTRARLIKAEYGQGGAGWPLGGYGLHGYDSFHAQGLRFQWRDLEGEKEGYVSWKVVEKEIGVLIMTGEYQPDVHVLEELDPFAIPDEIESYASYRENASTRSVDEDSIVIVDELEKENLAEELLAEDCMVTMLEYGPEFERNIDDVSLVPENGEMKKSNYFYNIWEVEKGGAKTRYKWNIDAIHTLKLVEAENRLATREEQRILSKYVGWGGLSQAFDEKNDTWSKEYTELKELLTIDEYTAARASVNNAFYTSPEVASCMSQALLQFGFRGGNILEPSMGIGNFFGTMPTPLKNSNLYGVELDRISGRIAKQLYQNANISVTGFENTTYPDNFFDAVIGNVPFGDYKVFDPKYNKYNFRIHDYFIAKALDQVRPGGMVCVITTKGTLDKSNPTIRKYLAERAELVGAIRLPNTAFKDSAGTEVTSDILFLQKRERKIDIEPDWVHLGFAENGIAINSYFVNHPEMMLGHMEYDARIYGEGSKYTVCINDSKDFNLYAELNSAIRNIKATMKDFDRLVEVEENSKESIPANPDVRNFTYTFFEGKLYFRENSEMVRQDVSDTAIDRIKHLDEIRQVTRKLIDIQMTGCSEEELANKQNSLNEKYDSFVQKYGYVTSKANKIVFRDDSDYPLLCSLEEVNEDGEVKKADMFYKQTIKAKTAIERVETAVEALNVSVNEFGGVNIPYMLSIYEPTIDALLENIREKNEDIGEARIPSEVDVKLKYTALISELEGLIFLNPASANDNNPNAGWECADEYLSGNVRDKLRVAKSVVSDNPSFSINVAALEKVQPEEIEASDIDVRIGSTWVEPSDYEEFIYELANTPRRARAMRSQWYNSGIQVHLNKMSMDWFIENKSMDKHSVAATKTYGTSRMDAYSIFEDTLNLKIGKRLT